MSREHMIDLYEDVKALFFGVCLIAVALLGCIVLLLVLGVLALKDVFWKSKQKKQNTVTVPVSGSVDPEDC